MEYSRRKFVRITSTAAGSMAAPMMAASGSTSSNWPAALPDMDPAEGTIALSPNHGTAGEYGTWTVTYRAGKSGIRKNGGIRVQLPDSWHSGIRNSANRLQASGPKADNYVSAHWSRAGIDLRIWVEHEPGPDVTLVKNHRPGLDGRLSRYIYVVRIWVLNGDLKPGDTLSVVYGDTAQGSRGMQAGIISTPVEP